MPVPTWWMTCKRTWSDNRFTVSMIGHPDPVIQRSKRMVAHAVQTDRNPSPMTQQNRPNQKGRLKVRLTRSANPAVWHSIDVGPCASNSLVMLRFWYILLSFSLFSLIVSIIYFMSTLVPSSSDGALLTGRAGWLLLSRVLLLVVLFACFCYCSVHLPSAW